MMESGELRNDIKIPEGDIGTEIKTKFNNGEDLLVSAWISLKVVREWNSPCFVPSWHDK